MQVRFAILIVLISGLLYWHPRLAETSSNIGASGNVAAAQQLRYKTRYTCNGDTIVVDHCRHDDDTSALPRTRPENDYCRVFYPDRPLRNGFRIETVELLSDVVKKLQACGAFSSPSNENQSEAAPVSAAAATSAEVIRRRETETLTQGTTPER